MTKIIRPSLTDVLLKKGLLTEKDVEEARENHRNNGENSTESLVRMGSVTQEEVTEGLAEQLEIPYVEFTSHRLDPKVMEIVPERIVRKYKVVLLSISGNILTLATAYPLNVLAVEDIKAATGYQIRTVISAPSQIEETINDLYSAEGLQGLIKKIERGTEEAPVIKEREKGIRTNWLNKLRRLLSSGRKIWS